MEEVVVLLSTWCGALYLRPQLDSLLQQRGVGMRVLVRDDGSPDDGKTLAILREYEAAHPGIFTIIEGENRGFANSFSILIDEALRIYPEAGFFAFADQDDVWLEDKLSVGIASVSRRDRSLPQAYCSNPRLVDNDLNPIGLGWDPRKARLSKARALVQNFATGCTMVFNRRAAELFSERRPDTVKVHDFLMYQICMFLGGVEFDPVPHILYRQHGDNQIGRPDAAGRMKKRAEGHYKEHVLELQAKRLLEAYGPLMTDEDRKTVGTLAGYRKNIWGRLRLLLSPAIKYTDAEKNFFFILKVILGTA